MGETLWLDQFVWLVFVAPFAGLLAAGLSKRRDPAVKGDRVLRHDGPARVAHWTHAVGCAFLLVSGIVLGSRFTPAFVADAQATGFWLNMHFVFMIVFLFGTFYWLGNTIISSYRFREHLPTKNVVGYTLQHYGSLVGVKSCKIPPEQKYFESERAAFILALGASVFVIASGLFKAAAHVLAFPDAFMNVVFWVHDISAALMLIFFVAHVFFAVIAPFSWKTFPSMITGYIDLDHAKHEHAGWIDELERKGRVEREGDGAVSKRPSSFVEQERKDGIEYV